MHDGVVNDCTPTTGEPRMHASSAPSLQPLIMTNGIEGVLKVKFEVYMVGCPWHVIEIIINYYTDSI